MSEKRHGIIRQMAEKMKGVFCMTKAEELKILGQIEGLIESAGADSYIRMTFAGVPEICRRNIEDDFGDVPVEDCANMRVAFDTEARRHDETKRQLAEAQKALKEAQYENERVRKLADEGEKNAHDVGRLYAGLEGLEDQCAEKDAEIVRLRAEIVLMKVERMTEEQVAAIYEIMEGVN